MRNTPTLHIFRYGDVEHFQNITNDGAHCQAEGEPGLGKRLLHAFYAAGVIKLMKQICKRNHIAGNTGRIVILGGPDDFAGIGS